MLDGSCYDRCVFLYGRQPKGRLSDDRTFLSNVDHTVCHECISWESLGNQQSQVSNLPSAKVVTVLAQFLAVSGIPTPT